LLNTFLFKLLKGGINIKINELFKYVGLIVSIISLYISYKRYKIKKDDNFKKNEERYEVYSKIKKLLYHIKTEKILLTLDLDNFKNLIHNCNIIFNKDINNYLNDIYINIKELQEILVLDFILSNNYRKTIILPREKEIQLIKWFSDHYEIIDKKFSKYL